MIHKIKLIPVSENSIKAGHIPKYAFHVAKFDDGNHKGFVKQTPELIEILNNFLKGMEFEIPIEEPKPRLDQMPLDM